MSSNGGNSSAKYPSGNGNGTLGGYTNAADALTHSFPNPYSGNSSRSSGSGSQGLIPGTPAKSSPNPYGGNGSSGSRSQGLTQDRVLSNPLTNPYGGGLSSGSHSQALLRDDQKRSSNPYHPSNARGTGGYVLDGPMRIRPTISRPSFAQGQGVRS